MTAVVAVCDVGTDRSGREKVDMCKSKEKGRKEEGKGEWSESARCGGREGRRKAWRRKKNEGQLNVCRATEWRPSRCATESKQSSAPASRLARAASPLRALRPSPPQARPRPPSRARAPPQPLPAPHDWRTSDRIRYSDRRTGIQQIES
eukprot:6022293-Pleurochrysis_carterae.AAC.5